MAIIIEYDQATGLGDQYPSIYSLYGIYRKLKSLTHSTIIVYCNSTNSHYFGKKIPGIDFYSKIFDYSFLDQIYFNKNIPSNFKHKRYWNSKYFSFYSDNNIDDTLLNTLDFTYMGHTTLYNNDNSYNPLNIRPLINRDLLFNHNDFNKFIVFHLRFHDGWHYAQNNASFDEIYSRIKSIVQDHYSNYDIVIGGRKELAEALENKKCPYIIKTEDKQIHNLEDSVISYAKDMVMYSHADRIFTYCSWKSNFITYAILHNIKQQPYKSFMETI
jgi:hypothetical protein